MQLKKLISFLNEQLAVDTIKEKAINGLQVENSNKITKVAGAVDCSLKGIERAIKEKCDCLVVHHGIFWGNQFAIDGRYYSIIKKLIENDIALIAFHLPLDISLKYGNNIGIIRALNLNYQERFGNYQDTPILFAATTKETKSFSDLCSDFTKKIGEPITTIKGNNNNVKTLGICSGGGLFGIDESVKRGCDTYITGDANHISFHQCHELEINLISGGHYNTETFGVKSLLSLIENELNIPTIFLDIPTNL